MIQKYDKVVEDLKMVNEIEICY